MKCTFLHKLSLKNDNSLLNTHVYILPNDCCCDDEICFGLEVAGGSEEKRCYI